MITMKRKGFTLIELLAVIVVLAVIAIITTPVILGVIEKSKKESYRNSIYGIMESANIYLANHLTNIGKTKEIAFTCNGINCSNEEGESLDFKGTVPKSGTFYLNGAGEVTVESVYNGKYYANTVDDKVKITEEDTTLSRAELTNMVKELQQEVKQLKTQVQQSNQNTSNIAALQTKHDSDVTSIWNKVGTEDLSSISNGSISKILINQNKLISDLNTNLNNKANSSDLSKYALASQLNVLNTKLDGKANISHNHDDRYYTESEVISLITNNSVKSVIVETSGVASTECNDSTKFGMYKYFGYTDGTAVRDKYNELANAGHKILGGAIVRGGLTDSQTYGNSASHDAITAGYNRYGEVPYQIAFYSAAYQTIRYDIVIYYI